MKIEAIDDVWIVVRSNKNNHFVPSWRPHQHRTREEADAEALRLAQRHPGTRFFIFQMCAKTDKYLSEVTPMSEESTHLDVV